MGSPMHVFTRQPGQQIAPYLLTFQHKLDNEKDHVFLPQHLVASPFLLDNHWKEKCRRPGHTF